MSEPLPLPVPPLQAILAQPRRAALDAFLALGWRPYARPLSLDPERRRLLNIDLSEPEIAFDDGAGLSAVAHVEIDREGLVTHLEVVGAAPADPVGMALALLGEVGRRASAAGQRRASGSGGPS